MVAACTIWGLSPLYYKALAHVPPLEVLSHRTLWSCMIFGLVLVWQGRFSEVVRLLSGGRSLVVVAFAGLMISTNWFVFILSVQTGHTVEASMGYFVFPLVTVVLAFLFLGERLNILQGTAVLLAALGVLLLTYGLGVPPWVALILSTSFGLYGVIKKKLTSGPVVSVTGEVLVLLPFALIWIAGVNFSGWTGFTGRAGGFFGNSLWDTGMLVFSGAITAGPLILFSYAARRLNLTTVGLMQYINPTLQFLVAVLIFSEPLTFWHSITFALIWVALALYSFASWRQERSAHKAATRSGTLSKTEM